jgi:outer membrane protein assembly factor BamB
MGHVSSHPQSRPPQSSLTAWIDLFSVESMRWIAGVFLMVSAWLPAQAQTELRFSDLVGWWSAEPTHGGESSRLALQFIEQGGRPEARLSIPAIGVYDFLLGEVKISGNSMTTSALAFPLVWDAESRTLSGRIPAEAVPVYDIQVSFKRAEPLPRPPPPEWRAPSPKIRWSVDTGGAPVWAGIERDARSGALFVANDAGVLHAIRREGRIAWTFDSGKTVRAQPRVIGRHVYLHSDSGFLHKLDARTGAEVWRARVADELPPRLPANEKGARWDRYGASVVADATHLYLASRDGHLRALDLRTGQERWRVAAKDMLTATPVLHDDTVIFAAFDGEVRAVSRRDGTTRWSYDARLAVPGDLTVAGNWVLAGSRSYDLIALDAASGREVWKRYYWFSWIESPPVVFAGMVYTGSSDATHVYARRIEDGALLWKTAVPGYSWQRPAVNDQLVIAGTSGVGAFPGSRAGALVAMERATGAIRWIYLDPPSGERAKSGQAWGFGSAPVIGDGAVYAADLDGRVFAFELSM